MLLNRGIFVTLEGVDGSGKSVSISQLMKLIHKHHIPVKYAKETTMTALGKTVRHVITTHQLSKHDQAVLFASARKDCMDKIIKPALKDHKLVICDRYLLSSLAYQSHLISRKDKNDKTVLFDKNHTLDINRNVVGLDLLNPDANFYIYLDDKDNEKRLSGRTYKMDRIDKELQNKKNLDNLKFRYNYAIKHSNMKCIKINGAQEAPIRARIIFNHIKAIIDQVNRPSKPF